MTFASQTARSAELDDCEAQTLPPERDPPRGLMGYGRRQVWATIINQRQINVAVTGWGRHKTRDHASC